MQRPDFIKSMAAAGAIAAVGRRAHAAPQGWREFEITFRISIKDPAAPVRLWVPGVSRTVEGAPSQRHR
jgi:hypothetical protein